MEYAFVNKMIVPVMKSANFFSERVDELLYGMKIEILSNPVIDWYYIKTDYDYTGYIHGSMIHRNDDKISHWNEFNKMVVINSFADIVQKQTVKSPVLLTVTRGAIVFKVDDSDENGFTRVDLMEGDVGYIKDNFLIEHKTCECVEEDKLRNQLRNQLVYSALSYLGTQYRWGGKSPLGIDCSGLCQMAYMLNGIIIYRDAKIVEGFPIKEIPIDEVKMGDLLYFPGHMAMYIGDYNYVHSTAKNGSDGVVINSLNPADDNYRKDLAHSLYAAGSIFHD